VVEGAKQGQLQLGGDTPALLLPGPFSGTGGDWYSCQPSGRSAERRRIKVVTDERTAEIEAVLRLESG